MEASNPTPFQNCCILKMKEVQRNCNKGDN